MSITRFSFDRRKPNSRALIGGHFTRAAPKLVESALRCRLADTLAAARRALPFHDIAPGGDLDRITRVAQPAARSMFVALDDLLPFGNQQSSKAISVGDAILERARTMQAGAHLLAEPKAQTLETGTGVPALSSVPVGLTVVSPAPFELVVNPDDPDDPDQVATSPLTAILNEDRIERPDDLRSYSFRVSLTRREQKDRRDDELLDAVLVSIIDGLAAAVDAELLGAIVAAAPEVYSLGKAAAKGVSFGELRALIGTGGAAVGDQPGALFVQNVPAVLCPSIDETVIAAFDRFGVAVGGEIRVLIERTKADGSVIVTCWAALKAVLPDIGFAWTVPAEAP